MIKYLKIDVVLFSSRAIEAMPLTMEFPFELVQLIHEYDRPLLRPDLARKYREGVEVLGEWPMVEACLQTDRADAILTIFESAAKAKTALNTAQEVAICITRRTHPVAATRFAALNTAEEVVEEKRAQYNALLLSLRILLIGEEAARAYDSRMDDFHDLCEHELDYMNVDSEMDSEMNSEMD